MITSLRRPIKVVPGVIQLESKGAASPGVTTLSLFSSAIVSADDVTNSKPDPETYLKCADRLSVDPADCIVFEDVPKGVESAERAGMQSVVITLMHTKEEFSQFNQVICFMEDFRSLEIEEIA